MNLEQLCGKLYTKQPLTAAESSWVQQNEPSKILVVYGSLAPGGDNHNQMAGMEGVWENAIIKGILVKKGWGQHLGYPGLKFEPVNQIKPLECLVFISTDLKNHFDRLDKFEGEDYERILIPLELGDNRKAIGNVYTLKD